MLVTAAGSDGRQLTDEEYAWANDMVFRGSLPPIDSFRITNYIGAEDRPFTFPTFGGPTLVNLGDAIYTNIHASRTPRADHDSRTHTRLPDRHTQDLVFTATAIADSAQRTNSRDPVYDYGAAGFDYTDLGIEAQAEVVEDWFIGRPARPEEPGSHESHREPDGRAESLLPLHHRQPAHRPLLTKHRSGPTCGSYRTPSAGRVAPAPWQSLMTR